MKMDRRSFLKGLLAVAVTPMLASFPNAEASVDTIIQSWNESLVFTDSRPYGRLGSLKLYDGDQEKWFALQDASITMMRRHMPLVYAPHPTKVGQYQVVSQDRPLIDSPWEVEFDVADNPYDFLEREGMGHKEINFEVDTRVVKFQGKGIVTEMGTTSLISVDRGMPLYSLSFECDERLVRV